MDACRERPPGARRTRGVERRLPLVPRSGPGQCEWRCCPFDFSSVRPSSTPDYKNWPPELLRRQSPISIQAPAHRRLAHESLQPVDPPDKSATRSASSFRSPRSHRHRRAGRSVDAYRRSRGAILSFSLFLTLSFPPRVLHWPDIVFFFAWLPFIITGGGRTSAARWIAQSRREESGPSPRPGGGDPFASVQNICGHYREGACAARKDWL